MTATKHVPRFGKTAQDILTVPYYFKDVNTDYDPGVSDLILIDEQAIKNQIYNLLGTDTGSDWFEPLHGSLLPYRLWEPISELTSHNISLDTIDAIKTWLSDRVSVDTANSNVLALPDQEAYEIIVPYTNIKTRQAGVFEFKIYRNQGA